MFNLFVYVYVLTTVLFVIVGYKHSVCLMLNKFIVLYCIVLYTRQKRFVFILKRHLPCLVYHLGID